MKNREKPSTSPASSATTDAIGRSDLKKPAQDEPSAAEGGGQKIDRPGFDLGGSSGDTQAGTGLGLGEDASDTPGDRRLPGRRRDGKLTIPRWSGPGAHGTAASAQKIASAETPPVSETKKTR